MSGNTRKMLTPLAASVMQSAMQQAPRSLDDLAELSNLGKPTVTRYVRALTGASLVYVADWGRDRRGYPTIRKYGWGTAADAPCPITTRTGAERMRVLRNSRKEIQ